MPRLCVREGDTGAHAPMPQPSHEEKDNRNLVRPAKEKLEVTGAAPCAVGITSILANYLKCKTGDPLVRIRHSKTCRAAHQQMAIDLKSLRRRFLAVGWFNAIAIADTGTKHLERKLDALQKMVGFDVVLPLWYEHNTVMHGSSRYNSL